MTGSHANPGFGAPGLFGKLLFAPHRAPVGRTPDFVGNQIDTGEAPAKQRWLRR